MPIRAHRPRRPSDGFAVELGILPIDPYGVGPPVAATGTFTLSGGGDLAFVGYPVRHATGTFTLSGGGDLAATGDPGDRTATFELSGGGALAATVATAHFGTFSLTTGGALEIGVTRMDPMGPAYAFPVTLSSIPGGQSFSDSSRSWFDYFQYDLTGAGLYVTYSVWWSLTVAETGMATVSTAPAPGRSSDTVLMVFDSVDTVVPIATNDDDGSSLHSVIRKLILEAGKTYYFVSASKFATSSPIISTNPLGLTDLTLTIEPVTALPAGDLPTAPIVLSGPGGTVTTDLDAATTQYGEPVIYDPVSPDTGAVYSSVWLKYVATESRTIVFTLPAAAVNYYLEAFGIAGGVYELFALAPYTASPVVVDGGVVVVTAVVTPGDNYFRVAATAEGIFELAFDWEEGDADATPDLITLQIITVSLAQSPGYITVSAVGFPNDYVTLEVRDGPTILSTTIVPTDGTGRTGNITLPVPGVPAGTYSVVVRQRATTGGGDLEFVCRKRVGGSWTLTGGGALAATGGKRRTGTLTGLTGGGTPIATGVKGVAANRLSGGGALTCLVSKSTSGSVSLTGGGAALFRSRRYSVVGSALSITGGGDMSMSGVKASSGTVSTTEEFVIELDPFTDTIGAGAGSLPPTAVPAAVNRWVFQDKASGGLGEYIFPNNPSLMSSPWRPREYTTDYTTTGEVEIQWEAAPKGHEWSFSGTVFSQAHHEAIDDYVALDRRIYVIDHRERAWEVAFSSISWTNRRDPKNEWIWDYSVEALILDGPLEVS